MPAQQASIQLRRSAGVAPSRWAISRPHRAIVIMPDRPMSSESICAAGDPVEARAEHQRGVEAGALAEYLGAGIAGQGDAADAAQAGPQARLPVAQPEHGERQRVHPGLQRRLFEVLDAVQARGDPVAAGEHLARHLGVAAFVGRHQRAHAEQGQRDDGEGGEQAPGEGFGLVQFVHQAPGAWMIRARMTLRPSPIRML